MRKSRFAKSQIIGILNKVEAGMKVTEVCRKHGTSNKTYYTWKSKYSGMSVSDISSSWRLCSVYLKHNLMKIVLIKDYGEVMVKINDVLHARTFTKPWRKLMC